jgi:hypothetical protein
MWSGLLKSHAKVAYRGLLGSCLYEKLEFRRHLGYWPNLDNPQTFNEKICARKFRPFPKATILADKIAVRDFVTSRIGSEFLTRLYYRGDCPKAIDYAALPPQFVLKGAHGSGPGMRVLVRNKSLLSKRRFVSLASRILRRRCGPEVNEWWYEHITPRILIEEMLLEENGSIPADLKFYVFNGVARYVQVIDGRHELPRSGFYDRDWLPQPFTREVFSRPLEVGRPPRLNQMFEVAEALAAGFDFVRVDLYAVRRRIIFGEMTLAPGAGWIPFRPAIYDRILGQCWSSLSVDAFQDADGGQST